MRAIRQKSRIPPNLAAHPAAHRLQGHIGQQRQMAGPLDRGGENSLMLGAHSRPPSRLYLGALGQVAAQALYIFIVNRLDMIDTKRAYPPARGVSAPGPAASAWPGASRPGAASGLKRRRPLRSCHDPDIPPDKSYRASGAKRASRRHRPGEDHPHPHWHPLPRKGGDPRQRQPLRPEIERR